LFALLLASIVCILSVGPCFGRSEHVHPPEHQVEVYLKTAPGQPSHPVEIMKREVASLLKEAGYKISWRQAGSPSQVTESVLLVLELQGVCRLPGDFNLRPPKPGEALATTAVSNGQVLPFSTVHCDALTRFLALQLGFAAEPTRNYLFGRAMGRVTAHELLHALTKSKEHDVAGVGKSSYTPQEVLGEHFEFETASLEKLRDADAVAPDVLPLDQNTRR
jgi:hypothetical protein